MTEDLNKVVDDIEDYKDYNPSKWLKNRNPVLIEFISGATGLSEERLAEPRKKLTMVKLIEQTYFLSNSMLIAPLSQLQSVVIQLITA